jgi:hypothetical protein
MNEEWRQIPSFPTYEASSEGRVRSKFRTLKQVLNDNGYWQVTLYRGGRHTVGVHWAVCEAFHGLKPAWAHHAAHRNGISTMNKPGNVRWTTALENAAEAKAHGVIRKGENHPNAVFTNQQAKLIRAQYKAKPEPATVMRLAEAFIVTPQTIRNIIKERTYA